PYKCDTCLCLSFGLSRSCIHSCNWPHFPTCIGGRRSNFSWIATANDLSTSKILAALMVLVKRSKINWLSMVAPATIEAPGWIEGAFSGELEGDTTHQLCSGSSMRKSR